MQTLQQRYSIIGQIDTNMGAICLHRENATKFGDIIWLHNGTAKYGHKRQTLARAHENHWRMCE